jgi:hypothetical protein
VTELSIESLGITNEELIERVVTRIVEATTQTKRWDEDDDEYIQDSPIAEKLAKFAEDKLAEKVEQIGNETVVPQVGALIEQVCLTKTNQWGEKVGKELTFKEFLVDKALDFMHEPVNYNGKTRSQDSYSWSKHSTRLAYLIDNHIHSTLDYAVKKALSDFNTEVGKSLTKAVEESIAKVTKGIKVNVKTS